MVAPASVYLRSRREYTGGIQAWDYPKDQGPKLLTVNGAVRWDSCRLAMIGAALGERYASLGEAEEKVSAIRYLRIVLGLYCELGQRAYEIWDLES
jgi:hypothetical protein